MIDQTIVPKTRHLEHYQRYKGYDYRLGAVMFITFSLEPRERILSVVEGDHVVLLPAGVAFLATLKREERRHPDLIRVFKFVIMPDHVHLRIYLTKGQPQPLKILACFVHNLKRWSVYNASKVGVKIHWQTNYHDWICLGRNVWEAVDRYIDYNPLKWSLMHPGPDGQIPLKVTEPLTASVIPAREWWSGVGAMHLLNEPERIVVVSLSRSLAPRDYKGVFDYLRGVARQEYFFASTFISPAERELFSLLVKSRMPIVHLVPDSLRMVYRPKGDEPRLFADDRYLMLSRLAAPDATRSAAWHGCNAALGENAAHFLHIRSLADCRPLPPVRRGAIRKC